MKEMIVEFEKKPKLAKAFLGMNIGDEEFIKSKIARPHNVRRLIIRLNKLEDCKFECTERDVVDGIIVRRLK